MKTNHHSPSFIFRRPLAGFIKEEADHLLDYHKDGEVIDHSVNQAQHPTRIQTPLILKLQVLRCLDQALQLQQLLNRLFRQSQRCVLKPSSPQNQTTL